MKNLLPVFLGAALIASWGYFVVSKQSSPFRKSGAASWTIVPSKNDSFEFRLGEKKAFDVFFSEDGVTVDTLKLGVAPSFQGSFATSGKQSFAFFHHEGGATYFDSDGDGLTDKKALISSRQVFVMQSPPIWIPQKKEEPNQASEPTAPSGRGSP